MMSLFSRQRDVPSIDEFAKEVIEGVRLSLAFEDRAESALRRMLKSAVWVRPT